MSDELNQSIERPVTVGYLKRLIESAKLPDDAVLYYLETDPFTGKAAYRSVGPEGQEIVFVTTDQMNKIGKLAHTANEASVVPSYSRYRELFLQTINVFKKESGQ